jgi:hypothetical protein
LLTFDNIMVGSLVKIIADLGSSYPPAGSVVKVTKVCKDYNYVRFNKRPSMYLYLSEIELVNSKELI